MEQEKELRKRKKQEEKERRRQEHLKNRMNAVNKEETNENNLTGINLEAFSIICFQSYFPVFSDKHKACIKFVWSCSLGPLSCNTLVTGFYFCFKQHCMNQIKSNAFKSQAYKHTKVWFSCKTSSIWLFSKDTNEKYIFPINILFQQ